MEYKELIKKGVDNYVMILKENNLYDEVICRIKRKNATESTELIKYLFDNQLDFSEYLFSDLSYSLDHFHDDIYSNLKKIIELTFQDLEYDFQVKNESEYGQTKQLSDCITFYCNSLNELDKIVLNLNNEHFELSWNFFETDTLVNFLNLLNEACIKVNITSRWFPIASTYSLDFIFSDPSKYTLIVKHNLMPPKGYIIDDERVVNYANGIKSLKDL